MRRRPPLEVPVPELPLFFKAAVTIIILLAVIWSIYAMTTGDTCVEYRLDLRGNRVCVCYMGETCHLVRGGR